MNFKLSNFSIGFASLLASAVVVAGVHFSIGAAQGQDETPAGLFGGTQINHAQVVRHLSENLALVVRTQGEPISATKLDWRGQVERAKDFFVNPPKFKSNRVLYLYQVDKLDNAALEKIMSYTEKPEAISVFLVGDALASSDKTSEMFYGTEFTSFTATKSALSSIVDDPMNALASNDLGGNLVEAGHNSVELAGPKGWQDFGRSNRLFVALGEPIVGLKAQEFAVTDLARFSVDQR